MLLKHADIWRAVDRLAQQHGLSPSSLARKAGLSPTVFNPSKRTSNNRPRWPSTESIARILEATGTDPAAFAALAAPDGETALATLPLLDLKRASRRQSFDEAGNPSGDAWEEIRFPAMNDRRAFALEISGNGMEPVYRAGTRIIVSPAETPRTGDRVAVRSTKHGVMLMRLVRENAQNIRLEPLIASGKAVTLPRREVAWIYRILWASQ